MFERFNDEARRIVVRAQEECLRLGHRHIGTEHFLLALARQDAGRAAAVLSAAGVPHARAEAAVERREGRGHGVRSGHLPFTPGAKAILERAPSVADEHQHEVVTPEHLFLALLTDPDDTVVRVLTALDVDPAALLGDVTALVDGAS
ncbi:ATP-dependent Clp protease ATP-binding subunit ClpA [Amycolatopsis bartoniae]|uniref:Clp R domain-containing protein n=1 Tax=Amycolatopsis bartoniae TaxID=941986 RepID=A0A8H9M4Q0_9PSEU|nr:Clp protease N-terminal domain-containing protein [Amycolatopsis bartoniae]MBB2936775.1 ATP-dependent Clp protease ATP-binding subunit ClpA [Amycolatopsis bartoniae]TVT09177.1 hypothetical protein FNH07_09770 [Amycolatopsis bartoniae]GHF50037.1 hypothetical protein GCM10017566_23900 [Amycolatopsis bartoniae]